MINNLRSKGFFVGVIITLLVIGLNYIKIDNMQKILQRVEGILYDARLLITLPQKKRQFDEQVIIVDIDEKSMREQGRYPWSRSKVSDLVVKLMDAGVVVIAFDIFFAEPERNPVDIVLSKNKQLAPQARTSIEMLSDSVNFDKELASTLSNSEVVLGFLFDDSAKTSGQLPKNVIDWGVSSAQNSEITRFQHVLGNISILQSAATGAGFINSVPESDGFIRKASLVLNYQGQLYPSLALETARVYTLADSIKADTRINDGVSWLQGLKFGKHFIPTNENGQIFIPYKGRKHSFPYISATDVLNDRIDHEQLEGTVAFVGTSAVGLADLRTTSVGVQYPGVEVHANVFEGLIHPDILPVELDTTLAITFVMLILTGVLLSILMVRQGPVRILVICLCGLLIHISFNWYCWVSLKVSLPLFQMLLLITLLTTYYGAIGFLSENVKRKQIKGMFDQYVPPAYIEKLISTGKNIELKSERREMSVLFADIRDFTTLSESFSPNELSEFMNEYLSQVTKVIFNFNGTIDKYVGDMVMAFWNAPLDDEQHAYNALLTALEMIKLTDKLTQHFTSKGWPEIRIGIGISTGEMNVGDMGSSYRKAYTVLGDSVNLGSRLEALTKYYEADILISENTYFSAIKNGMLCREIDTVLVKGKLKEVTVYQPLGLESELSNEYREEIDIHQQALEEYSRENWVEARSLFKLLKQSKCLTTKIYDIYLERIETQLTPVIEESGHDAYLNYIK